jgi:tetratricopeptide (TPR) repeat protein
MGSRFPVLQVKRRASLAPGRARGLLARAALVACVGLWSMAAQAAPPKPKNPQARKHFERAVELYKAEDFDAAAAEANRGLELETHEALLFILAQAERQRGNCLEAVEIINRFIEITQSDDARQNALTVKALCAEELAALAKQAEQARLEAEKAAAEAAARQEETKPEPEPEPEPPRPWYRDPLGGALVGVGGAGLLAGAGVLIAAAVLDPDAAADYGTYAERKKQQPTLLLAGGVTAGVGVLVGVGGAVRWVLVAKKAKAAPKPTAARIQLAPWIDRERTGVVITGRF